jgi:gamma-glutamyl hercynylcysteine S-oxide synthase
MTTAAQLELSRDEVMAWYRRNRHRTAALFDVLTPDTYYEQPIALRHPIVFYEGHLPAFSLNTLVKKGLGLKGIDDRLERLFARGIDPDDETSSAGAAPASWPDRTTVRAFADAVDELVLDTLQHADLDRPGHPLLDRAQAVFAILEHEAMHQETLLYMWHRLPYDRKRPPRDYRLITDGLAISAEDIFIPAADVVLGAAPASIAFGWDNEFPQVTERVPAFGIERVNVTNGDFLAFVEAGGYARPEYWTPENWDWVRHEGISHPPFWSRVEGAWHWRGMFEPIPLPLQWPVYVSHAEASAYARWRGRRLPSEAEYQRAAYGSREGGARHYPWGNEPPDSTRGVFDFYSWEPEPAGSHPRGRSAWGVDDLVGNGWEWTSSVFAGFPGFQPIPSYPEYSADFFDGQHYVMKGASPATARELLRPTFRNWFRPRYPYVYATFRCVREAA